MEVRESDEYLTDLVIDRTKRLLLATRSLKKHPVLNHLSLSWIQHMVNSLDLLLVSLTAFSMLVPSLTDHVVRPSDSNLLLGIQLLWHLIIYNVVKHNWTPVYNWLCMFKIRSVFLSSPHAFYCWCSFKLLTYEISILCYTELLEFVIFYNMIMQWYVIFFRNFLQWYIFFQWWGNFECLRHS